MKEAKADQPSSTDDIRRRGLWRRASLDTWVVLGLAGVVVLALLPMLATGDRLCDDPDGFLYYSRHGFVRRSLLEHHTFPLRSHAFGGGYPTISDPEDPTFNPLTALTVAFGAAFGIKLIVALGTVAAAAGTYLLARRTLGHSPWGAAFASAAYALSLWLPLRLSGGNPNEVYAMLLPLCLFLACTAPRRVWVSAALPLVLYIWMSDGKQSFLVMVLYAGVALSAHALAERGRPLRERTQPLLHLLLALGFTFFIGQVRILPVLELIQQKGGVSGAGLWNHPRFYAPRGLALREFLPGFCGWGSGNGMIHAGILPVVGCAVALAWRPRRSLIWAVPTLLFVWLTMAERAPVDLLSWLIRLPLYAALDTPRKYFAPVIVFGICLGSAGAIDLLRRLRPRWLGTAAAVGLVLAAVARTGPAVAWMGRETYTLQLPAEALKPVKSFYAVKGRGLRRTRRRPLNALAYVNLLRGRGTVDWYSAILLPEHAQPRFFVDRHGQETPNPAYRGEAWFLRDVNRARVRLEPNRVEVSVEMSEPDILVINQNHHPAWRSDAGVVHNRDNLLAVRLDKTGAYQVRLRYRPASFLSGAAGSACGVVVLAVFVLLRRRGKLPWLRAATEARPEQVRAPLARLPSAGVGILVLALGVASLAHPRLINWRAYGYVVQGGRLLGRRRTREGMAALEQAVRIDPSLVRAHVGLGLCRQKLGDLTNAEAAFRKALSLDPHDSRAHYRLGALFCVKGRPGAAAEHFRAALAADREMGPAHCALGLILLDRGRVWDALRHLQKAVERTPNKAFPRYALGRALVTCGRPQEAVEMLRSAMLLNPKLKPARELLAKIQGRAGSP